MLKHSNGWIAGAAVIAMTALPVCVLAQDTTGSASDSHGRRRTPRTNGSVVRDNEGIPHIAATTEREALYLQGFTHAQDRLFQMDVTRRQAEGTLAELLGSGALPSDVQLRTFGLRRAAAPFPSCPRACATRSVPMPTA
jgi:penicillin amidase